ncbi:hypothetical protein [Methylocaldum sp. GT1TLB]|jgi:hypothetical protein|uniref:hypothetical protein n=1 Tax=Methylocaldum sp. GT1TLB TaxID=3438965 RepID=UPI003D9FB20E
MNRALSRENYIAALKELITQGVQGMSQIEVLDLTLNIVKGLEKYSEKVKFQCPICDKRVFCDWSALNSIQKIKCKLCYSLFYGYFGIIKSKRFSKVPYTLGSHSYIIRAFDLDGTERQISITTGNAHNYELRAKDFFLILALDPDEVNKKYKRAQWSGLVIHNLTVNTRYRFNHFLSSFIKDIKTSASVSGNIIDAIKMPE